MSLKACWQLVGALIEHTNMDAESRITKVIKHDDGTVQEVATDPDGSTKETFYKPYFPTKVAEPMLTPKYSTCEVKRYAVSEPTKQMFFYTAFVSLYMLILIMWMIPLNPHFLPKPTRKTLFPISYPIYCNRAPIQDYVRGCYNTYFCVKDMDMPEIQTPAGSFFPNFTKSGGGDGNYHKALKWALTVMNNNCTNVTIHYNNSTTSNRNDTDWKMAEEVLLEALFILQSKCHPEAYLLSKGWCAAYRMGFISIPTVTRLSYTHDCNLNWTKLYSDPYTAMKGPACTTNSTYEHLTFPELFLFIEKIVIGTQ
ncbi:hypothetical protein KM546_gp24 [Porcine lymphotropic herpesvirus 3]|uniref:Uncharacterized protein n=1 Tax=Suid gammaherpesvirus 5 TaxID=1960251 RepID=Q8B3Z4_9GAMA|nr:hypothetical protein KM546_gp24 [Porcine lymphotropic herpesvirus 3]AAO12331.1 unknown [Porcine lymphotropic herpesvirus 3]